MKLRQAGVSERRIGGEVVILDLESSMYYTVGGSGAVLLDRLRSECTEDDLVATLLAEYDVDEPTARRDVRAFVSGLAGAGLVTDAPEE